MKHSFFTTFFAALLSVLVLMGGRYVLFSFRIPSVSNTDMEMTKTIAVSRGSVERINEEIIYAKSSIENPSSKRNDASMLEDNAELRLLTFNIRHGVDENGVEGLDSIIESIKETGAEIIALQEVDRFMPRSGFKDQAKEIAKALGYNYVYGETINLLGIKYGNAILSAFPIVQHENKKLYSKEIETRGLLKAVVDLDGILYNVYTTHLGLNSDERIRQIEQINQVIEEDSGYVILMGDFNEEPNTNTMQEISDRLIDSAKQFNNGAEHYTYAFYSDKPNTRIDRIYVDRDITINNHYVIEEQISDHCMVMAIISRTNWEKEGNITLIEN